MIKLQFVCHGNICRSPMAEFVCKDMIQKAGYSDDFFIASSATSTEEIGNPVHYGTREQLQRLGISTAGKYAIRLTKQDYDSYDYFLAMDQNNIHNIMRIFGSDPLGKVHRLLDYTSDPRDIADPWYTGDFDLTYTDIVEGLEAFLPTLLSK